MMIFASVAIVAGSVSILRIVLTNPNALSNLVWAEDGLFPLCIQGHGYFSCLTDPFAGYFLFLSRTLAYPVSLFPQEQWPLVSNLVAAISVGVGSGLIAWLIFRVTNSAITSVVAGLVPVALPIVGLEAINASGSVYMILLIAAAIIVSFNFQPELPNWLPPLILLVTALTIPSSVVLLLPLLYWFMRERKARAPITIQSLALVFGLVVQAIFIISAENARSVSVTFESLREWISQLPLAGLTFFPGLQGLSETGRLASDSINSSVLGGTVILVILAAISVALMVKGNLTQIGAAWLLVSGILLGLIPALSGYSNNRYFVIPLIALLISLVILISNAATKRHRLVMIAFATALLLLWTPSLPAAKYRANASPPWNEMLSQVKSQCEADPNGQANYQFTPNWPFVDAVFLGPTTNLIPCTK